MGNRVVVKPHNDIIVIRPNRRNARGHYMNGCMLKNVVLHTDDIEGDLLDEYAEVPPLGDNALKHLTPVVQTEKGFVLESEFDEYVNALDAWIERDNADEDEPEHPKALTDNTYRAAFVYGPDFYVG